MNNQDERFWSEFSEEELKDPTNRQVLAALRDSYHIDEDDRQSVQRAWKRVSLSIDQASPRRVSQELTTPLTVVALKNVVPPQRSPMRKRIDTLVALCIILLLVGSMIGIVAHFQSPGSALGGHSAPTATSQPINTPIVLKHLGTSLGGFSLGMPVTNIMLKQFCQTSYAFFKGEQRNLLCKNTYLQLVLNGPTYNADNKIAQLIVWGTFQGKTAEGLGLGMSFAQFQVLYDPFIPSSMQFADLQRTKFSFPLYPPPQSLSLALTITDGNGTTLWVLFNLKQQVVQIVLLSNVMPKVAVSTPAG